MSSGDLWMRDSVTYYGYIIIGISIIGWIISHQWRRFADNLFRSHLTGFEAECAVLAGIHKKEFFETLRKIESNDEILRSIGCIRILEIGVKTGENIQFYPDGAHLICVDWNKKLIDYLTLGDRSWQFGHIYLERLIIGDGSSLKVLPSGCVDVVVTTRSLCSSNSITDTLAEIRRVLALDGKYFFLEHVPDPEGTFANRLQKFLTRTNIWPSLFGNCHLNRHPIDDIKRANFKNIVWNNLTLEGYVSQPFHLFLTRHHVVGTATR